MSEIKTGGRAFPSGEQWRDAAGNLNGKGALHCGMTLRDYFAAKAMQGILAGNLTTPLNIHTSAYEIADSMIAAREKQQ